MATDLPAEPVEFELLDASARVPDPDRAPERIVGALLGGVEPGRIPGGPRELAVSVVSVFVTQAAGRLDELDRGGVVAERIVLIRDIRAFRGRGARNLSAPRVRGERMRIARHVGRDRDAI